MLCILNVGTVPMLCILYVGTVPTLCILNIGTVPTFSHSQISQFTDSCEPTTQGCSQIWRIAERSEVGQHRHHIKYCSILYHNLPIRKITMIITHTSHFFDTIKPRISFRSRGLLDSMQYCQHITCPMYFTLPVSMEKKSAILLQYSTLRPIFNSVCVSASV